jgi:hypothetical protein
MAQRDLVKVDLEKLQEVSGLSKIKKFTADFPKKSTNATDFKAAQQKWLKSVPAPSLKPTAARPIKGVLLNVGAVDKLRAVHESTAATAELIGQQLDPDQTLGTLHSALTAYEYIKLQAEYKKRLAAAAAKDKATVEEQWQQVVSAAQAAHASAGLADLKQADLDKMAAALNSKQANFNAVATIANSATNATSVNTKTAAGNFITQIAVLPDLVAIVTTIHGLCDKPITGSFTKHFAKSFQLQVSITVWCPTWTNPFRTCKKTFTLAGVSFTVDLSVGYSISCCGATAWGQAAAQVCASIVGISVCASCTASITAVAGTGKSGSGSSCSYGLGLNAELKCQFAGINLFDVNVPFGWTISGPCLPLCNLGTVSTAGTKTVAKLT